MQLIIASHTILTDLPGGILKHIEAMGRVCYKSEDRTGEDTAGPFVRRLIASGHESVLEHASISVNIVCDRGVSHELVRHRLASYSQESTRFCNYSAGKFGNELTFILPSWLDKKDQGFELFKSTLALSESSYIALIQRGWKPEQARNVLPNALKTEINMTANLREWRHILKVRTAPAAHPQMRELMLGILNELKVKLPDVFCDILAPTEAK